jgi:cytochrome c-type biogenesis protein
LLGDVGRAGTWVLAGVFVLVGLNLLGVIPAPRFGRDPAAAPRRGAVGAVLLGLTFGAALGPCTFAFMAPLLAIALGAGGAGAPGYGVALVAAFGSGHAVAIAGAGASVQSVNRWLGSRGGSRATAVTKAVAGACVLLGGVYFVRTAL